MKEQHGFCRTLFFGVVMSAGAFTGCTTYVQAPPPPARTVYVAPPAVEYVPPAPPPEYQPEPAAGIVVVIHTENDFYQPLSPYGRWVEVPGYGRCWTPAGVDQEWRPYADGHWQRTDAGWYWVSDERWGWATYHYGRWRLDGRFGWVWIPQTQWAPAWVAWREGGGYTGWAPLPPEARFGAGRSFEPRDTDVDAHAFVFVRQEQMMEPHHHQNVIVNNTTIINRTVNITKIQVVNNVVVNEGPRPDAVARATGRKVEVTPYRTLRNQQEGRAAVKSDVPQNGAVKPATPDSHPAREVNSNEGRQPVIRNEPGPVTHGQPGNPPKEFVAEPGQPPRTIAPGPARPDVHSRTNVPTERRREVIRPGTQPGQPPNAPLQEQLKPQPKVVTGQPGGPVQETKPTGPGELTPQQKLEQEKRRQAAEKRLLPADKNHRQVSTNSPAPPH